MPSDTFETYYMVMREDGNAYSQVRHATESDARFEAQRLCQKTGKTFVVLQAIARVKIAQFPVAWQDAE